MTIRRDARRLEGHGAARQVHGGLMLPHGVLHRAGFAARAGEDAAPKQRIADVCVGLVDNVERVFLDAGTTAYAVARALPQDFAGTLITHSVPVMQLALQLPRATTIALGGQLLHDSQAFVGHIAITSLGGLRAETAFIGVAGIDEAGLYIERDLELPTKRAIMTSADRVVLVAANSKLDRSELVRLGGLDEADMLVTDGIPSPQLSAALEEAGVTVLVADESEKMPATIEESR